MSDNTPDGLIWLDLETTGLDLEHDEPIEVAAIATAPWLTAPPTWPDLPTFHSIIATSKDPLDLCDAVVYDMHMANGLLEDVAIEGRPKWWVDELLVQWVEEVFGEDRPELWLAGSGVAQFDIHWIRKHFPRFAELLSYKTIDVSPMRRFMEQCAGLRLTDSRSEPSEHRSMSDARRSLGEAVQLADWLRHGLAQSEMAFTDRVTGRTPPAHSPGSDDTPDPDPEG